MSFLRRGRVLIRFHTVFSYPCSATLNNTYGRGILHAYRRSVLDLVSMEPLHLLIEAPLLELFLRLHESLELGDPVLFYLLSHLQSL